MTDDQFELIISICDSYGRLALHLAAFSAAAEGTATVDLSVHARHLLEWTTERVLPALLRENTTAPLQELDLSRISFVNESMVAMETDDVHEDLQAPILTPPGPPPRKKGNLNATPERLDGSFVGATQKRNTKRKDSKIIPGDATVTRVRAAAFSLLRMSCVFFSEWLAVFGGSGAAGILQSALKWCAILAPENNVNADKENPGSRIAASKEFQRLQIHLLPAFARLSIALGRTVSDFELLKRLLLVSLKLCDDVDDVHENEEKISSLCQETVSTLLSFPVAARASVSAVLEVAYEALSATKKGGKGNVENIEDETESCEVPGSMCDVVDGGDGYIGGFAVVAGSLQAIASHKKGSIILADLLLENFDTHAKSNSIGDDEPPRISESVFLFEAKCLWFLSDAGACRGTGQMNDILQKLGDVYQANKNAFKDGTSIKTVVKQMVEPAVD